MKIATFIQYTIAILELLFFLLTMYYLITGLKTKDYGNLKKYGIMYIILNFIRRVTEYTQKRAMAVSIIGGADGPTSVFLAGKVGGAVFLGTYILWILVVALIVGILIYKKKKK